MAAIFYKYSDKGMFKNSVGGGAVPLLSNVFDEFNDENNLAILTQYSVTHNEVNQFFPTFDNFVHHFYFGGGLGTISLAGVFYQGCAGNGPSGQFPGLDAMKDIISNLRGEKVKFSLGKFSFFAVLNDFNLVEVSEPETMINFTFNLTIVLNNMPSKVKRVSC